MGRSTANKALLRAKIHIEPGMLARVPTAISEHFSSPWAPAQLLVKQLAPLPVGLLRWWASHSCGHVLIGTRASGYEPGGVVIRSKELRGVAYIRVTDLVKPDWELLVPIGRLLDHLLGCDCDEAGTWLSDGGGTTKALREVGQRLQRLFPLGYGLSQAAQNDPHAYFAEGFAYYCHDRRALNVVDPVLERLLRTTLMHERFWQQSS
ncbi:MAG TPA: hypothetical protein EYP04_11715 [Anaerolineae bacterium]|nr:hypothetical protein [Anaerolineae bacterium]HIQ05068.1 hypothetical protein [Anaerolineae bacterium]